MKELLEMYTVEQIIIFIVMLAAAFKGVLDFFDWAKKRYQDRTNGAFTKKQKSIDIEQKIDKLYQMQLDQDKRMIGMQDTIELLMKSDKDDIKAWITEKHHYFCYEVKAIDYYSLESIERRYENYKKEHGNSYVETLMQELQALPKIENDNVKATMILDKQNHS